jgi:hypothetical protein
MDNLGCKPTHFEYIAGAKFDANFTGFAPLRIYLDFRFGQGDSPFLPIEKNNLINLIN